MLRRLALALTALLAASLPGAGLAAAEDEQRDALAQQFGGLVVYGDIVQAGTCVLMGRFSPGERVVFRARVVDAQTGLVVESAEVVVRLEDGTSVPLRFGPHPPPHIGESEDTYWTGVWAIRPDTALGVMRYTMEATEGPRFGRWEPFNFVNSLLTVVPSP